MMLDGDIGMAGVTRPSMIIPESSVWLQINPFLGPHDQ